MMYRTLTLTIEVTAPATVGENEISAAINAALDEPPCDWDDWEVGAAIITAIRKHRRNE